MYKLKTKNEILEYCKTNGEENTCAKYNISKSSLYRWLNPNKRKEYNAKQLIQTKQYKINNKEKVSASQKKTYEKNKIQRINRQHEYYKLNKASCLNTHKKWANANKQHLSEYFKNYYSQDSIKERIKKWRKDNKDKLHGYYIKHYKHKICLDRKRRALKYEVNENYSICDEQYTRNLFDNKCAICGSSENLTIDHWYPLIKKYPLTRKNAVLMCQSCNSRKHDNMPHDIYDDLLIKQIEDKLM